MRETGGLYTLIPLVTFLDYWDEGVLDHRRTPLSLIQYMAPGRVFTYNVCQHPLFLRMSFLGNFPRGGFRLEAPVGMLRCLFGGHIRRSYLQDGNARGRGRRSWQRDD